MSSKEEIMRRISAGLGRESFEHSDLGTFDVTALRAYVRQGTPPVRVLLSQIVPHIKTSREVCPTRVNSLPEFSWLHDPAIFLVCRGTGGVESHVMVDGHHRAMRRHQEGLGWIDAYFIPVEKAPRPGPGYGRIPGLDWGEKEIVGGKLVPKGRA